MRPQCLIVGLLSLAVAGSLAACAPVSSPSPSGSPAASAEPSASASPTVEALALTCEALLGPELWAESGGQLAGQDYLDKTTAEGSPLALFISEGGVLCPLAAGNEIGAFYAASPVSPATQAAEEARLISEGYVASSVDGGTLYVNETSGQQPPPQPYFFRDGSWWMASTSEQLMEIVANWPGA